MSVEADSSELVAGDFWSRVPEEGSQLWERRRRSSRRLLCAMQNVTCPAAASPSPRSHPPGTSAQTVRVMFVLLRAHGGKDPSWKRRRGTGQEAARLC